MAKRQRLNEMVKEFYQLDHQSQSFTTATQMATPPTLGQLKKMTQEAERIVQHSGQKLTPSTLFLAMLAVISCQVTTANYTYWTYIPNPPLLQAISWGEAEVIVYTNETQWMPGPYDSSLPQHLGEEGKDLTTVGSGLPVCIGMPPCLQPSYEALGLTYNHSHFAATTFLLAVKGFKILSHNITVNETPPTLLSLCPMPNIDPDLSHLSWTHCRGKTPKLLVNSTTKIILEPPLGLSNKILIFSLDSIIITAPSTALQMNQ